MNGMLDLALRGSLRAPWRSAQLLVVASILTLIAGGASALSFALGRGLGAGGDAQVVVLMSPIAEGSPERSLLDPELATVLAALPQLAGQRPLPEVLHHAGLDLGGRSPRQAVLRSLHLETWDLHRSSRLIAGQLPGPGEILVGRQATAALGLSSAELAPGSQLHLDGQPWRVSGILAAPGSVLESELFMEHDSLLGLSQRSGPSLYRLRATNPGLLDQLDLLSLRRPDLEFAAFAEPQLYAELAALHRPLRMVILASALAALMAGVVGAMGTLAAAIAARRSELACLRAIGFSSPSLAALLALETAVLSLAGCLIGLSLALGLIADWQLPLSSGALALRMDGPALASGAAAALLLPLATLALAIPVLSHPLANALRSSD